MLSGTIVRHLLLPGQLEDSKTVVHWFAKPLEGPGVFQFDEPVYTAILGRILIQS